RRFDDNGLAARPSKPPRKIDQALGRHRGGEIDRHAAVRDRVGARRWWASPRRLCLEDAILRRDHRPLGTIGWPLRRRGFDRGGRQGIGSRWERFVVWR